MKHRRFEQLSSRPESEHKNPLVPLSTFSTPPSSFVSLTLELLT